MTPLNGPVIIITPVAAFMVLCIFIQTASKMGHVSNWDVEMKSLRRSSYSPFLYVPEHPGESLWPSDVSGHEERSSRPMGS